MPSVSIVICAYNRCESLRETLVAVQNQQIEAELSLEIFVVDNNSTDQTKDVVSECSQSSRWPIHYLFEPSQGKSYAQNTGIQAGTGDFVAFLDDDVVPERHWLNGLYDTLLKYNADCVGGPVKPLWLAKPPKWLEDPRRQFGMLALLDRGDQILVAGEKERLAGNFLFGSNLAVRRSVFSEVGLFRTDLGPSGRMKYGGEDSEMVKRLLMAGKKMVYVPKAMVRHRIPSQRMTLTYLRKWNYWTARSTVRISEFKRVTPRILLWECAKSTIAALCYYVTGAKLKAIGAEINFWWRLGMLTEMLFGKNRQCQALA